MARASIGLTTADAAGGMHVRAWEVPADWADGFAARATALFGEPSEMVGDVAAIAASGNREAAEGRAVFLLDPEGGGNG